MKKLARLITTASASSLYLLLTKNVFAQTATLSAETGGGTGGTDSALLYAGTNEITYVLFFAGLVLFVFGSLKIVASFRD